MTSRGAILLSRFGRGEQFQIVGVGLVLAAVPIPPTAAWKLQPGRLILVVLTEILADVAHDHGEFFCFALLVQGNAKSRQAVDGQLGAVAVEEVAHPGRGFVDSGE